MKCVPQKNLRELQSLHLEFNFYCNFSVESALTVIECFYESSAADGYNDDDYKYNK